LPIGNGAVAITLHHIYYEPATGSKRIKHDKIVSIAPYADGVLVSAEGASDSAILFETSDPGFFANILQNAQNWA
jgi:hypothetical protein